MWHQRCFNLWIINLEIHTPIRGRKQVGCMLSPETLIRLEIHTPIRGRKL